MKSLRGAWNPMPQGVSSYLPQSWAAASDRTAHVQNVYGNHHWGQLSGSAPSSPHGHHRITNKIDPQSPVDTKTPMDDKSSVVLSDVVDEDLIEAVPEQLTVAVEEHLPLTPEEQLVNAFNAVAADGVVDFECLTSILATIDPKATPESIQEAIREVIPKTEDSPSVATFSQALDIFQRLTANPLETCASSSTADSELAAAYSTDNRSLCQLLVTVVGVMFFSAVLVAGLSVLWLWMTSTGQNEEYLKVDLTLLEDMLEVMVHQDYRSQKEKLGLEFAVVIATLVEEMGFGLSNDMGRDGLDFTARFLGRVINEWWQKESVRAVEDTTMVLGSLVQKLLNTVGVNETIQFITDFNNESLDIGYELLLGMWADASNTTVKFLTPLRYKDQCYNNTCGSHPLAGVPIKSALSGKTGVLRGFDYRPAPVQAGYTYFTSHSIGMVYKVDVEVLSENFATTLKTIFDKLNAQADGGREILLGRNMPDGTKRILTTMEGCDETCVKNAEEQLVNGEASLARALRYEAGRVENIDYRGLPVIAGYMGVPNVSLGVSVKVSKKAFGDMILRDLGRILEVVNQRFTGSQELELAISHTVDGVRTITNLTQYRFVGECHGACNISEYMWQAAATCSPGVMDSIDYRGKAVVVGYTCMPELNTYVSYKVDSSEITSQGLQLAVDSTNQLNLGDQTTTFELEIGQSKPGIAPSEVHSGSDLSILTKKKFADECPNQQCGGTAEAMQAALHGVEGVVSGNDYRDVPILAATGFLKPLFVGLVAKVDSSELMSPVEDTALLLLGVTMGSLLLCSIVLTFYTRKMVVSMIMAEKEGQEAIMKEKQRFSDLVQAMYPAYLVPRVLSGDREIVQMIPHAAVFFSDIYDFTTASNRITSEELLELMGYTYGLMDKVADYFCVAKVKTVGDAFLAITGLPGTESRNCCLDMMRFASCVAQIFSCKFDHPSKGSILSLLTARNSKKKKSTVVGSSDRESQATGLQALSSAPRQSVASRTTSNTHSSAAISEPRSSLSHTASSNGGLLDPYAQVPKVRCIMSYGIAAGPVTAGVLQGKSPVFDIWGKTVNLASRMQSTGLPGRIQVSELFYRAIIAVAGQLYDFEESHETMCKGFGMVKTYYVQSTIDAPPKDLVTSLGLIPNLGLFFFENPVPAAKKQMSAPPAVTAPAGGGAAPHQHGHHAGRHSNAEKTKHPHVKRADPHLVHNVDPLILLDTDE